MDQSKLVLINCILCPPAGYWTLKEYRKSIQHILIGIFMIGTTTYFNSLAIQMTVLYWGFFVALIATTIAWRVWVIDECKELMKIKVAQ